MNFYMYGQSGGGKGGVGRGGGGEWRVRIKVQYYYTQTCASDALKAGASHARFPTSASSVHIRLIQIH